MSEIYRADRIIAEARKWIGTPYVHQASTVGAGCDCLGLLRGMWRSLYGSEPQAVPPYSADWDLVEKREQLLLAAHHHLLAIKTCKRGCLIVFRWQPHLPAKHLAINAGAGRIIHAYERAGVIESPLGTHWQNRIAGCFAFPEFKNVHDRH